MPIYEFYCLQCGPKGEMNIPIEQRDKRLCNCGLGLRRKINFKGSVYSNTANGGMK